MKKHLFLLLVFVCFSLSETYAGSFTTWTPLSTTSVPAMGQRTVQPQKFAAYRLNIAYLKSQLALAVSYEKAIEIELPNPQGEMIAYRIWETPLMAKELADKYPEIKNYTAEAIANPAVTAKVNFTVFGFDAMVFGNVGETYVIDPYTKEDDRYYQCYYKSDYPRPIGKERTCHVGDLDDEIISSRLDITTTGFPQQALKTNGATKRTYRLALACTGEYAVAVTSGAPTKPAVLSAMNTTMARVNGVYERELGVTMQIIANNDQIIYLNGASDPYTNNSGVTMQGENQANVDNVIGTINYDIGHVFSTGGGGIADLQSVCDISAKARGVTGQANPVGDLFDIDYVAHEMGHQFGATHTFNAGSGSCAGNGTSISAYEPGAGSTIMAYAGLCNGNNIAPQSDDYFHAKSIDQMSDFITNTVTGGSCASISSSGNTPPAVASIAATYNIPHKTPFELQAPQAVDADNNGITYCWEQYDLGDFGKSFNDTKQFGPIFRSFKGVSSRWRVFPTLDSLLVNNTSYLGEKLPTVDRVMNFKLTVRDIFNGTGAFNLSDNEVKVNATTTSGPFEVLSPNQASDYWQIGSTVTVTWDVAQTTTAPVNCSNVDILLSIDGGYTYPVTLVANTANDGSESFTVPNGANTNSARVKIKAANNIFFDISNNNFKINDWPSNIEAVAFNNHIAIFPIPATGKLNVVSDTNYFYEANLFNAIGQSVWKGEFRDFVIIDVSSMAAGVYSLRLLSSVGDKINKKVMVQ